MKKIMVAFTSLALMLMGCARDLSSNVYTSDSTLSVTLKGKVLSVRPVVIKDSDHLSDNTAGMLGGGAAGAVAGANVGQGNGQAAAVVGGALLGAVGGALIQGQLGKSDGFEYVIKVDTKDLRGEYYEGSASMRNAISSAVTSGLVTVVQGKDVVLNAGQDVYVIYSDKRTRIISAN